MVFQSLETERLMLTELCVEDEADLFKLFSNPSVVEYYDLDVFREHSQAARGCSIFCVSLVTGRYERLSAPRSVSTAVTASDSSFAPGVSNAQMPARYRHKAA